MAIHPIPDHIPSQMEEDHGTVCLITDRKSDWYLNKATELRRSALKELKTITDAWTI